MCFLRLICIRRIDRLIGYSNLASLPRLREYTSHRISSYDATGGNRDAWRIQPGEKRKLAEIQGPGCIKHIWMTLGIPKEDYTRRIILRFFWDGCDEPSVECPIGDFFGVGHGIRKNFVSLPLQMSPQDGKGFNSWWPMPLKQKTAYEIMPSLVGSEMCIRDRSIGMSMFNCDLYAFVEAYGVFNIVSIDLSLIHI